MEDAIGSGAVISHCGNSGNRSAGRDLAIVEVVADLCAHRTHDAVVTKSGGQTIVGGSRSSTVTVK